MRFLSAVLASSLPFLVLASDFHSSLRPRHREHARNVTVESHNNRPYILKDIYQGYLFLIDWDFFTEADPTHGNVNYQSKKDAIAKGLAYVQLDGTTVLAVDDTSNVAVGGNRNSVRISSKKTYNGGLFIADFKAMPYGCTVWPAWWSLGPNWPAGGEIDVLEGVNEQATNQYTLHTSEGCTLSSDNKTTSAQVASTQCASIGSNNAGCFFVDSDPRTYGKGFNSVGGGVYAHLWDNTGIKVWRFARSEIPLDIHAKIPNPSTWGIPAAFWSSSTCDMASHFHDHVLVLDTTLCGDWAGATYASAGCPGSCAEAVANPKNYASAKWKINYIAVYQ